MDYTTGRELKDLGTKFVQMSLIVANPDQPRQEFNEEKLQELAINIDENGLLQPIVIRLLPKEQLSTNASPAESAEHYMIVAGERRFRAHVILQREAIQARIIECTDRKAYELSLLENLEREDINLLEEAQAYHRLKAEFSYNLEQLGKIVSKSPSNISNIMGVMKESVAVRSYVVSGVLTLALLVWLKQLPNEHEKLELLRKLEAEEIKRTHAKAYIQRIVKAYKIALELDISAEELLKERIKQKGKGGRFDVKQEVIPEDFRFCFIIDNLIDSVDLEYFPRVNILISAFSYLHSKSNNKQLGKLLMNRSGLVETLMMDSGVVPAAKKKQWSYFDKVSSLHEFYDSVKPDVCVGMDVPAYAPVLNDWGLSVAEIIEKTVKNMKLFREWTPKFSTIKMYPIQGVKPEEYLDCFSKMWDAGVFEDENKIAVGFGSIARCSTDEIIRKLSPTLQDPRFVELRKRLEFVHGFGVGQPKKHVKLYQEGINSFDALTCTILTATGQYWMRNGYYYHVIPETPSVRRLRMLWNVNAFWGLLTEEFAIMKGIPVADAFRNGVEQSLEKLARNCEMGPGIINDD